MGGHRFAHYWAVAVKVYKGHRVEIVVVIGNPAATVAADWVTGYSSWAEFST
jgi:hypothetical protein